METQLQDAVRRAARRAVWIAIAGAVAGIAIGVWLSHGGSPLEVFLTSLGCAMALGGLGAALSTLVSQFRLKHLVSAATGGLDAAEQRDVQRAVLSAASIPPALESRAVAHAHVLEVTLPLVTAQQLFLFCGIAGSQVNGLASDVTSWFRIVLVGVLVVVGAITVVQLRRSLARVRRFLAAHDDVAAETASTPPAQR
ncbi:hypothetical protein [Curtobacterium sp. ER1/6]|uniref:hypothetical protein n=1 Tax=Curtobacterium sp. ER1/6 TaxID=1891920 RepID=UPI00084FA805|nr:hypothetical protein [Curtobacterium sp. ER1/6]OEI70179.1 hypothetical protein Cus16_0802 [Curtobacterium sp. ER1/6]